MAKFPVKTRSSLVSPPKTLVGGYGPNAADITKEIALAPARAMAAQSPEIPETGSGLGNILLDMHRAIDPVGAFGGYGNMAAMALPPGASRATPKIGPSFQKWFEKSKIVGPEGKPLRMYHGTKSDFEQFDLSKTGASDDGLVGKGFYFTSNPAEASGYALNSQFGKGGVPNVRPVHVAMKNPYVIKHGVLPDGRTIREIHKGGINSKAGNAIRKLAEDAGHDGVVFADNEGNVRHAVAFRTEQIKSAIADVD